MRRNRLLFLVVVLFIITSLMHCKKSEQKFSIISMSRTIRVPVQMLSTLTKDTFREHLEALTLSEGGEDELPQGPQSFGVLHNGSFVIADPLQRRVVFYDSLGQYLEAWEIGFPVSRVTWRENDYLEVIKATTGDTLLMDDTGQLYPSNLRARSVLPQANLGETKLLGLNRGVISRPRTRGQEPGILEINFKSDSTRMISLQDLGMDTGGNTFVAMETTHGKDTIDIIKYIRKYSADGKILCQINDIPFDYYVHPEDEFRIKKGLVYQMQPKQSELRINVWNTN